LIKATASEPAVSVNGEAPAVIASPANAQSSERPGEIWPGKANGFARDGDGPRETDPPRVTLPMQRPPPAPPGPANGDHRRTLHLSLGNGSHGNGGSAPAEHLHAERSNFAGDGQHTQPQSPQHQTTGERSAPPAAPQMQNRPLAAPDRGRDGENGFSEVRALAYHGPVQRTDADVTHRKEGAGSYIDQDLRARVDGDIAAFLAAFDAALAEDTQASRSALREATDRLLRAGARTRIELERLEARMPLPPRDNIGRGDAAWRQR